MEEDKNIIELEEEEGDLVHKLQNMAIEGSD
jgi:hypothetical protein